MMPSITKAMMFPTIYTRRQPSTIFIISSSIIYIWIVFWGSVLVGVGLRADPQLILPPRPGFVIVVWFLPSLRGAQHKAAAQPFGALLFMIDLKEGWFVMDIMLIVRKFDIGYPEEYEVSILRSYLNEEGRSFVQFDFDENHDAIGIYFDTDDVEECDYEWLGDSVVRSIESKLGRIRTFAT